MRRRLVTKSTPSSAKLILIVCLLFGCSTGLAQEPVTVTITCAECHDTYDTGLEAGPHRLGSDALAGTLSVSCASCHTNGNIHIEEPSPDNIGNPANSDAVEITSICTTCHTAHLQFDGVAADPHMLTTHTCISCHSIHTEPGAYRESESIELCQKCHTAIAVQFIRQSSHPLSEGVMNCLSCHSMTGFDEPQVGHGGSANCYACHPEQGGPFRYGHDAANSFSPNGHDCTACHAPHGSSNDRLLTQPGSALCNQCHGTPPRHRTAHFSGLGIQYQCVECHSEIHGSDNNRKLLDPDLDQKIPGGNCFNPGCHAVN